MLVEEDVCSDLLSRGTVGCVRDVWLVVIYLFSETFGSLYVAGSNPKLGVSLT
jgi:hypothetical protein